MALDWINFHWYESGETLALGSNTSSTALAEVMAYLKIKTGKPLMNNECGQRSTSSAVIKPFLQLMVDYGVEYIIWYDGDDGITGPANGLNEHQSPFSLRQNGIEFKPFVNSNVSTSVAINLDGFNTVVIIVCATVGGVLLVGAVVIAAIFIVRRKRRNGFEGHTSPDYVPI